MKNIIKSLGNLLSLFRQQDFITKVVILDCIFVLLFTITVGCAIFITEFEPSIYIGCVYTACLGEGGLTALIKIKKKGGENDG